MHDVSGHRTQSKGGSRTAAAAREFIQALGDDLAAFAARQWRNLHAVLILYWKWLASIDFKELARRSWTLLQSGIARLEFGRSTGRVLLRFGVWTGVFAIVGGVTLVLAMMWVLSDWPLEKRPHETNRSALLLEAQNGEPLGRIGFLRVADVPRDEFPDHLVQAVLSIEDRRFYSHLGVDPLGVGRALLRNLEAGHIVEGGSTITQQLVKIRLLGNDRTYARKAREALMAAWLELRHGKDDILTQYLNSVYMGGGAYGMGSAARLYFDKAPAELTLAEAAMLAGMIKSPSQFNPIRNLRLAQARAGVVIDAMLENGVIDEETADEVRARPAALQRPTEVSQATSWFADWVATEAAGLTDSFTRTVRVRTTLLPNLQGVAERVVNDMLAGQGAKGGASQAALVALRPDGAVVAMVGGRDYEKSQFNRAAEANRHPGSAFKLFVYLAALRKGYSLHDTIDASPLTIKGWEPENYGGQRYGSVTLAEGFSRSINTAAVRLAMQVGLKNVIAAARDLGIDAQLSPYPSLALGAAGVSLVDLTGAFASVSAGRRIEPWGVAALGAENQPELRAVGAPVATARTLGPERESMLNMLRLVVQSGTGRGAALNGFAAGKTGTSQNHRDAWFIGFNEKLVVGVWVGNDDGSPMRGVVGGTLPAAIWKSFMTEAGGLIDREGMYVASVPQGGLAPMSPDASIQSASASEDAEPAQCDLNACSARYQSFRASDCTYQPYSGSRRICPLAPQGNKQAAGEASEASASAKPAEARSSRYQRRIRIRIPFVGRFGW